MKMLKSVIYFTLLATNIVVCEPDYHFVKELDGWLKLHVVPATWQQAFLSCHYEGAVLASPINSQLASALRSVMSSRELDVSSMYIGVNALFSPGDYFSIEGVPLADMDVKWNTSDNGEKPEDCLRLSDSGDVHTTTCEQWLPYVCYKKRDETSQKLNECGTFDNGYKLNEITGKCYKLHKALRSWNTSYKICAAEGGHLAIINNKEEADAVTALYPESKEVDPKTFQWEPAHIGLRDWNKDFTWLTIHGEKIENVYNTWAKDQPDNRGVNTCGSILRDGTLDDIWCSYEIMFICEKDPHTSCFERPVENKSNRSYFNINEQ